MRSIDRNLPIASIRTGRDLIDETLSSRRLSLVLLSVFAAVALVLSVIGVYGVLSFTVSQQAREIGIRMALGAAARDVLGLMLWKGLWPVVVGLTLGLGAALGATRVLTTMLFEVRPSDPVTLLAVVGAPARGRVRGGAGPGAPRGTGRSADRGALRIADVSGTDGSG